MPYNANTAPSAVKDLPTHARAIWIAAFNSADKQYDDESRKFAVAWAAVKQSYTQDANGKWHRKNTAKAAEALVTTHYLELDIIEKHDATHCVWGWSSIVTKTTGEPLIDLQGDLIDIEDLAEAVYAYVEESRVGGEMHDGDAQSVLIESMVFTPEKLEKLGIPSGTIPLGWWTGYRVSDATFARVQEGSRLMFSIEGLAVREPVEE